MLLALPFIPFLAYGLHAPAPTVASLTQRGMSGIQASAGWDLYCGSACPPDPDDEPFGVIHNRWLAAFPPAQSS